MGKKKEKKRKQRDAVEERPSPEVQAQNLYELLMEGDRPHFTDFIAVSETMMKGYSRFIDLGLPRHTIALAMLGGALNLYDMFDMRPELPELLRSIADRIENGSEPN
ncbi:hypothetical protein [Tsuneonella mangrovi]|uniref:hypothetical protein n=1 Tax=Tsuneonella mangrovi TaxID=1982042 RepID=UPI0012377D07|nr:hypothetical protein [Tsuneonella mangrovi]